MLPFQETKNFLSTVNSEMFAKNLIFLLSGLVKIKFPLIKNYHMYKLYRQHQNSRIPELANNSNIENSKSHAKISELYFTYRHIKVA